MLMISTNPSCRRGQSAIDEAVIRADNDTATVYLKDGSSTRLPLVAASAYVEHYVSCRLAGYRIAIQFKLLVSTQTQRL